jgi:hypothetical protein
LNKLSTITLTMNLNNPSGTTCVKIRVSNSDVPMLRLFTRTKSEKKITLEICEYIGEENLEAICSHCELDRRKCAKKDAANPHYGCTKKCCLMLHYWDMCSYCIEDRHTQVPVFQDEEKIRAEVVTFQRVFSKLPEDIQRYISEYVPQVFTFVTSINRIVRRHWNIERHLKLPKSVWSEVQNVLANQYAVFGFTSRSSRNQICERTKDLYKRMYKAQYQPIVEKDFWTHKPWSGVFYNTKLVNTLEAVHAILPM